MDTPPPACSSPDLTDQDERGLRGSVGLCVAPCCDQTPYRLKTQFHRCLMRGGKATKAAAQSVPPPPQAGPLGLHRTRFLDALLHHWRGISFVPRAEIRRTRGLTGARALSAGSWLGRRRLLPPLVGGGNLSPLLCGLGPNTCSGLLQAGAAGRCHSPAVRRPGPRTGCIPASGSRGYSPGRSGPVPPRSRQPLKSGQRRRRCPTTPHPQHTTAGFPPTRGERSDGRGKIRRPSSPCAPLALRL